MSPTLGAEQLVSVPTAGNSANLVFPPPVKQLQLGFISLKTRPKKFIMTLHSEYYFVEVDWLLVSLFTIWSLDNN